MDTAAFEPESLLAALAQEGVRYVVIGGLAAVLQGSPVFTQDVDICPARYPDLISKARALELGHDLQPPVAALEDVIRSKEAANRPKDIAGLPVLRTLLAEIRRRESR